MSLVRVPTNFNIDLEFNLPEFHRRLIALTLDFVLQFFYLRLATNIYFSTLYNDPSPHSFENAGWILIIIMIPAFLYPLICELTLNGQTLGKKITRIVVVNEMGGKPSFSQLLIRYLLNPVNYLLLAVYMYQPFFWPAIAALLADLAIAVISKKFQRTGDILAHTILIRTGLEGNIQETVFMEVSENYMPSFPQIMQLSDRDINAIKSILDMASRKGDYQLAEKAMNKIKNHLGIESSLSAYDFLEVAMKDYNYLSTR